LQACRLAAGKGQQSASVMLVVMVLVIGMGVGLAWLGLGHGSHRGGCPKSHASETLNHQDERRLRRNETNPRPGCPIGIQSCRPLVAQRSREPGAQGSKVAQEIRVPVARLPVEWHSAVIISCRRRPNQDAYHHQTTTTKRPQRSSKLQPSGIRPASRWGSSPILDHDHISQL
jgi:hypothetical protein